MTGSYVFTGICLLTRAGDTPVSGPRSLPRLWFYVLSGGYPSLWSHVSSGGVPQFCHRACMGIPKDKGSPLWDYGTTAGDWDTLQLQLGNLPQDWLLRGRYASCGFLQEDFLVYICFKINVGMSGCLPIRVREVI